MLFGLNNLNENALGVVVENVEALAIPAHLNEEFGAIAAYGNAQAETLFEQVLEAVSEMNFNIQRGVSKGNLMEGLDYNLNEGALANFYGKVKALFQKLVAAVKALFQKFMAWLDSKWMDDSKFIAKYEKILMGKANSVSDMIYKAHDWKLDKIVLDAIWAKMDSIFKGELDYATGTAEKEGAKAAAPGGALAIGYKGKPAQIGYKGKPAQIGAPTGARPDNKYGDDIEDAVVVESAIRVLTEASERDIEAITEGHIKAIAGTYGSNATDAAEAKQDLNEELRGKGGKEEMTGPNVVELMGVVKGYAKEKAEIQKAQKAANKAYDTVTKELQKAEKAAKDNVAVSTSLSKTIQMCKDLATLGNSLTGTYLTCAKERRGEYKGILAAVVGYKKKA